MRRGAVRHAVHHLRIHGPSSFDHLAPDVYAYLLGVYLGDGWIGEYPRGVQLLRVTLDAAHPRIAAEVQEAVQAAMPRNRVAVVHRATTRCFDITCYSKRWSLLFPRHGPGRKHDRSIALVPWQRTIVASEPAALIRGLIHSDGSRYIATVRAGGRAYGYVRYAFTNRSDDIKTICCEHLDLLGIPWTRPNERNIEITRQHAVRRLDEIVGPKR